MGSALEDFFEIANRIAASTGFDAIELGVIWLESEGYNALLGLRGVLCRAGQQGVDAFDAETLHARRIFLAREEWKVLEDGLARSRLDLGARLPIGEFMIGSMPIEWDYSTRAHVARTAAPAVRAFAPGGPYQGFLGRDVYRSLTPRVASHSNYEIASFSRLAQRFLGTFSEERVGLELLAPWPIHDLQVERNGAVVKVLITGNPGLDPARFIINIESTTGDRRLRSSEMSWITSPREDVTRYAAAIDDPAHAYVAVNLYFEGIEEVHHRAELQESTQSPGESRRARPLPSQDGAGGQIVQLHVERFRSLRDVQLDVRDLRVLIGPNQAGKSTVLDALAFLREAVAGSLYDAVVRRRGGLRQILWRGDAAGDVQIEVEIEHAGRALRYGFVLGLAGPHDYIVEREVLHERRNGGWQLLLSASSGVAVVDGIEDRTDDPRELLLPRLRSRMHGEALRAVTSTLTSISVFPGFQTGAGWVDPGRAEIRQPARIEPGARLEPLAGNLTAVLHSLSQTQPEQWDELIEITRLVFPRLQRITFPPAAADRIQLAWHEEGVKGPFYAVDLSDGTLHFLAALCALYQSSSLIAIDEPENHLHPEALYRWIGVASKVAARVPVLVATQSTQLLGFVDETPEAIVVLRRGPNGTEIIRPSKEDLDEWVKRFSLADLRQELESWGQST